MNITSLLGHFVPVKQNEKELYLSLLLDPHAVAACAFDISPEGESTVKSEVWQEVRRDTWEERIDVADKLISDIEEENAGVKLEKVVLGLTAPYITDSGEIRREIRGSLKQLTTELSLVPVGFVVVSNAIANYLKRSERVPPTVILWGIAGSESTVTLYKVGKLIKEFRISTTSKPTQQFDEALRSFSDVEILPSRILLFGSSQDALEDMRQELLRYPWQQKANFMHFPKIDILTLKKLVSAVAFAGVSELADVTEPDDSSDVTTEASESSGDVSSQTAEPGDHVDEGDQKVPEQDVGENEKTETADEDESEDYETVTPLETNEIQDSVNAAVFAQPDVHGDQDEPDEIVRNEDSNIEMVDPIAMGFHQNVDVTDFTRTPRIHRSSPVPAKVQRQRRSFPKLFGKPWGLLSSFGTGTLRLPGTKVFRGMYGVIVAGITALIVLVFGGFYVASSVLPKAHLTLILQPQNMTGTEEFRVVASDDVTDSSTGVIIATRRQQSESAESSIQVTGTKDIGDPAKGTVTIYNKTTDRKVLKKGTVLESGQLAFVLDSDLTVDAATESIGSITFGKGSATVTAAQIGPQSNVPADTEFSVKGTPSSQMIARNDQVFSGGTSKSVNVVSRADQTALVEKLTADLIEKAKSTLSQSVNGGEVLIDETVSTEVTERHFQQELGQEATDLTGGITVSISGLTVRNEEISAIIEAKARERVNAGYTIDLDTVQTETKDIILSKNGSLSMTVNYSLVARPDILPEMIRNAVAGKTQEEAQEYLRQVPGVAGVNFQYQFAFGSNRLPKKAGNIFVHLQSP